MWFGLVVFTVGLLAFTILGVTFAVSATPRECNTKLPKINLFLHRLLLKLLEEEKIRFIQFCPPPQKKKSATPGVHGAASPSVADIVDACDTASAAHA